MSLSSPGNLYWIKRTRMKRAPDVTVSCRCLRSPRSWLQNRPPSDPQQSCARQGACRGNTSTPSPHHPLPLKQSLDTAHRKRALEFNADVEALIRESDPEPFCFGLEVRGQRPNELGILTEIRLPNDG